MAFFFFIIARVVVNCKFETSVKWGGDALIGRGFEIIAGLSSKRRFSVVRIIAGYFVMLGEL